MFKKVLAFFAAMSMVAAFAAVDVNKATEAELDSIKGIGPVTSKLIMAERKKSAFKNWDDFVARVKGVGPGSAADFSAAGLTVSGAAYTATAADTKTKTKADDKKGTKADAKSTEKPVAGKTRDAAVATKDAAKGAAVATKNAVVDTAKDARAAVVTKAEKADGKPAAVVKADVKAEASKPAASAAKQ
ncbi:MAG: hypothetical protein JWP47_2057 [Polaromonas sp.]|jgi:competence protein ComEA|nr:hypothetical protein [Polaromonas sp.]